MRYVVTTGYAFTDIDSYACVIAYADLLRLQGKDAVAIIPGPLNESVIREVREWPVDYSTTYFSITDDVFVLQDISNPEFFAKFVDENRVVVVYDHRPGFEEYWKSRVDVMSVIEKVGACATYIVEDAVALGLLDKLSPVSCDLLYTAIIGNSLNLKAGVTTERDTTALSALTPYISVSADWPEKFFRSMQAGILNDPVDAMKNDTKIMKFANGEWVIGQLELWNASEVLNSNQSALLNAIQSFPQQFGFVTLPSISEAVTYVLPKNDESREILESIGLEGNKVSQLRLRKEWLKLLQSLE